MKKTVLVLLLCCLAAPLVLAQYVAEDPSKYVPNCRIVGLGKAYVGLADDIGSMYTNPAGMTGVDGWQFTSMSGKFFNEYDYLSLSGLYNTEVGVFGLGYVSTAISGAYATTIEVGSDPDDPVYAIDTTQPLMGSENSVMFLSYGNKLDRVPYLKLLPQAEKLSLGANLKFFKARLYGDGIKNGDGSGQELDLGLKYQAQKWLSVGFVTRSLLPTAAGGKLSFASGHTESYPANMIAGVGVSLLGKNGSLFRYGDQEVKLAADYDLHPTLAGYPGVMHFGLEWKPLSYLAVRTGLDQDALGDGAGGMSVASDQTYGVGVNYGGFNFDYAYHSFVSLPGVDSHFFSLSYMYQPAPKIDIKDPFLIFNPADKLITFDGKTALYGRVVDPRVRSVTVNAQPVKLTLRGEIPTTEVELTIGKNGIKLEGSDDQKSKIAFKKIRVLRLVTFPDVPTDYWVAQPVSLLAMQRIITGYPDGTFRPEGNISRAEMCSLLMKTKGASSEVASSKFKDVKPSHWAAKFIAEAAATGVVKGYPGNVFRPAGNITRAEGLAMIARFAGVSEESYVGGYPDLANSHWAAKIVAGATKAGLLEYLKGKEFVTNRPLTRAETVEMLQRTAVVKDILAKDLLDWDSY